MPRLLRGFLIAYLLAVLAITHPSGQVSDRPILILVSIDGWRWDYLTRFEPPALGELARAGVTADGLIPIFPSKTFPNHHTIVTGLHAARHGLTSNAMVDPHLPGRFTLSDRLVQQDTRWWGGEPVWVGAERQGQIAATMFWPGSDAEIAGDRPTYFRVFDESVTGDARVDQLLAWLNRPDPARPTFLTLYFDEVDTVGHRRGPDAAATRAAALNVDASLARLVAGVARLGLSGRVNYVIVSDHGMAALSPDRTILIDDYLDLSTVDVIDTAPVLGLVVRPGTSVDAVYTALHGRHPALRVFTRDTLPVEYRLRGHPRIPDVLGIANDGWHPTTRARLAADLAKGVFNRGNHGYEARHRSMHGLFVASGPAFATGLSVAAFDNVHVYELLCRVLGLEPAPNDGDPAVTAGFLRAATKP